MDSSQSNSVVSNSLLTAFGGSYISLQGINLIVTVHSQTTITSSDFLPYGEDYLILILDRYMTFVTLLGQDLEITPSWNDIGESKVYLFCKYLTMSIV